MKKTIKIASLTVLGSLLAYVLIAGPREASWYSVLPALMAISMVYVTRNLYISMGLGIILGGALSGYIHEDFWGIPLKISHFATSSLLDPWNLQILFFIPIMIFMVNVMIVSGGIQAIVMRLMRISSGRKSAQGITVLSGLLLFFDDYANTMVVGTSMRPLADRHKTSRAKLAFLVDATSAPIAGIALISTWVGYEIGLFSSVAAQLGLQKDGFAMFFDAISYRYYCFIMIILVIINTLSGRDFGPMLKAETTALAGESKALPHDVHTALEFAKPVNPNPSSCVIPLGSLFITLILGFWVAGGGLSLVHENPFVFFEFSAWQKVLVNIDNSVTILLLSSVVGLAFAVLTAWFIGKTPLSTILTTCKVSLKSCLTPIAILVLAWGLKNVCDDLGTGRYLVTLFLSSISPLVFPMLVFCLASLTSFATGTSWGTMAILIPTMVPVAFSLDGGVYGFLTIICLGAILDGSIFGDHCSPISDTTIMSSAATQCDHIEHVKTQIPYAILAASCALFYGYFLASYDAPLWVTLLLSTLTLAGVFFFLARQPGSVKKKGSTEFLTPARQYWAKKFLL